MIRLSLLFSLLFISIFSYSQSIEDLNKEKDALLQDISDNSKLLDEYATNRNKTVQYISLLDSKISKRFSLIDIYNRQISIFNNQVNSLSNSLDSLEKVIFRLKGEYSRIIYHQYLNNSNRSGLVYLLSASSFNESYRRFLFLKQFNSYRRDQSELLSSKVDKFNALKANVNSKRMSLSNTIINVENEAKKLSLEREDRKLFLDSIINNQKDLESRIILDQKRAKLLEEKIELLILEEAKKAKANKALSDDILSNKGILPWPTKKHIIVSDFGEHDHPVISSIKVRNNGIDLDVVDDNTVRPVHKGKVSRILMIPGNNASVIIRHGNVLTVYSNLSEVFVKADQDVDSNIIIGTVFVGESHNSNILHFEIWLGEEKQDPKLWLEN